MDNNPSNAEGQMPYLKFASTPRKSGVKTKTRGNIGVFINGVALFDYRDGCMG